VQKLRNQVPRGINLIRPEDILDGFQATLKVEWVAPAELLPLLDDLLRHVSSSSQLRPEDERGRVLLAHVCRKFRLNDDSFKAILDEAAKYRVYFNYHDKERIRTFLDCQRHQEFSEWLARQSLTAHALAAVRSAFKPKTAEDVTCVLAEEIAEPENRDSILISLFGAYVFSCFPQDDMYRYFNPECHKATSVHSNFFDHLRAYYSHVLHRECALLYAQIDDAFLKRVKSYDNLRASLFSWMTTNYDILANHCYLAVHIKPLKKNHRGLQWRIFSDLVLFAEKHRFTPLQIGYFHPQRISRDTVAHIADLEVSKCDFETANEGYFYRDCFIMCRPEDFPKGFGKVDTHYDLLLLFQKNERDETLIPCPACRSHNVQGNSYPVLGVRSWECNNPFCPDRSKYNRGKRYQLASLMKQQAIEDDHNQIPRESILKWKLDVVPVADNNEVIDMLIRHYSLFGDTVRLVNVEIPPKRIHGRQVISEQLVSKTGNEIANEFFSSAFFRRYKIRKSPEHSQVSADNLSKDPRVQLFHGDAFEVLQGIPTDFVDGAVTSPPYYNARSYTQWPNIYCYLYDIYNIAIQVFRVLKPGAPFLFNIFDYFDNENIIVFSAMGKKRMILGAYIVELFSDIGFDLNDNIIWHKGEIEGKRNFNQGNTSPYYQAPHNCWEHIFVFSKGPLAKHVIPFPGILRAQPVIKMVHGVNQHGHTAPFPPDIPSLLLDALPAGSLVLDPFSGSMTTGRVARGRGFSSINIEYHREYCELGLRLMAEAIEQLSLF